MAIPQLRYTLIQVNIPLNNKTDIFHLLKILLMPAVNLQCWSTIYFFMFYLSDGHWLRHDKRIFWKFDIWQRKSITAYRSTHVWWQVLETYERLDLGSGCKPELADCLWTQPGLHNPPSSWNRAIKNHMIKLIRSRLSLTYINLFGLQAQSYHSWSKAYPQWSFWLKWFKKKKKVCTWEVGWKKSYKTLIIN